MDYLQMAGKNSQGVVSHCSAEGLRGPQDRAVAYLVEENRSLRRHVRGRLRLTDEERRRLSRPTRFSGGIGT